jgi:hypothetical protein
LKTREEKKTRGEPGTCAKKRKYGNVRSIGLVRGSLGLIYHQFTGWIITLHYMGPSSSLSRPTVRPCVCCWSPATNPPPTGHREEGTGSRWLGSAQLSPPPPPSTRPRARRDLDPDPASCARRRCPFPLDATAVEWDHPPELGRPLRSLVRKPSFVLFCAEFFFAVSARIRSFLSRMGVV